MTQLPALPEIRLRGLVMSTRDRGSAMLDVDGKPITIALLPRREQQRVPIPALQFAEMQTAIDQRAASVRHDTSPQGDSDGRESYEMSLRCSFVSGRIVFNLEGFTEDAILLRALPHGSVVLVRSVQ